MANQIAAAVAAPPAPNQIPAPDMEEEDLLEEDPEEDKEDDEYRTLTEDDFGDDEDEGRGIRYLRWLNDDGSMDAYERNL